MTAEPPLLRVNDLRVEFPLRGRAGKRRVLRAVDGVSLTVQPGRTLGIVGESGCGKSTLARALVGLVPIAGGTLEWRGLSYARAPEARLRPLRRAVRLVFQDPLSSLNPRLTIGASLLEPLAWFEPQRDRASLDAEIDRLLERVGLPRALRARYPHELSGGQNQRVNIARALLAAPQIVICDEPASALDVSLQAQILNLLRDLQQEFGVALLFISHDLTVVRYLSDELLVMYLGRGIEQGPTAQVFERPRHPYTRALLDAVPVADPVRQRERLLGTQPLRGEPPSPIDPPSGCAFRTRCPRASPICGLRRPELDRQTAHAVACHHPLD
ncbi:MAG: ATP-binding cassette domain-containing protein [Steroidobacteraceae bacterium]|nr:ATP-binding cassette domain-containing protein [Steroidobacteraceae bacterium]MDW8260468.1 ATP-binding cassette domain-containing protein [Gammaproteobacteria bacterium]